MVPLWRLLAAARFRNLVPVRLLPIYEGDGMPYLKGMPGLSTSELAIVVFILLLVVVAGRLPRWGEALGSYLYRRRNAGPPNDEAPLSRDDASTRTPPGTGPSGQVPPPS
jgi:hypothetical protein